MWLAAFIFFARVVDMSLGTVRLICVTRGRVAVAVGLGFVEVVIWVCAAASVLRHLDQWMNIVAYAGGYATGLAVGMWLEEKLALGTQTVTLMSRGHGAALAGHLRKAGMIVTSIFGTGRDGPTGLCLTIIPRRRVPALVALARTIDPSVFVAVEDVRDISERVR